MTLNVSGAPVLISSMSFFFNINGSLPSPMSDKVPVMLGFSKRSL